MSDGVVGLGLQNSRDTRSDTIGPDDELGGHIDHLSVGSGDARTAHATVGSPEDIHDMRLGYEVIKLGPRPTSTRRSDPSRVGSLRNGPRVGPSVGTPGSSVATHGAK